MSKYNTATPYIASYVLLRDGDKIAFVLRSNTDWMNNYYGLPSGKVEWKETFTQAAIREAKEEVGIDIQPEHIHHVLTMQRHSGDSDWIDAFFAVDRWDGEVVNAEPHMHSEVAWLDIDNLPDNVIPSVRFGLEQVKAGMRYAEYGWDGQGKEG
jgi:ADP-ribose pyrophosphatase YjhB (NUDIX family)